VARIVLAGRTNTLDLKHKLLLIPPIKLDKMGDRCGQKKDKD